MARGRVAASPSPQQMRVLDAASRQETKGAPSENERG
jgi:hypothetical protein